MNLIAFDNVGMVDEAQYFYLGINQMFQLRTQNVFFNYLNRDFKFFLI
jgi:hypothetical protein